MFKEKLLLLLQFFSVNGTFSNDTLSRKLNSLRIFGLLMHKCWLVRKRQWITSLIGGIIIPISLIFSSWIFEDNWRIEAVDDGYNETRYERRSFEQLIDQMNNVRIKPTVTLTYAPSNLFIDQLMTMVKDCMKKKVRVRKFNTESDLVAHSFKEKFFTKSIAVIFDESTDESTTHLRYKLRPSYMNLKNLYNSLLRYNMTYYYTDGFLQVQFCLDQSYVKIKSKQTSIDIPQIFIQRLPYPAHHRPRIHLRWDYISCVVVGFAIPLFIEILRATKEKFVGINVLMSMNGISNTLNLLSWIISGLIVLSTFCMLSVLSMIRFPAVHGSLNLFLNHGNPFVLFVVLICHFAHSISFGIHVSAYFYKSVHLTYALITVNALAIILRGLVLEYVNLQLAPYVGMIVPLILLYQAMQEIDTYEAIGIGVQWSNLFVNGNPEIKIGGTVGTILILSLAGTFLHLLLAIYVFAIRPGKCGIGKHPLFFLMCNDRKKENDLRNLIFDDVHNKYFEPTCARTCTPGIQIRNLKKFYDVSLFNKEKVKALKGVSIDFYKGQITSLLGHNGAGKSTLMSILTGSISPSDGLIMIDSKNLKDNASEILRDIGFYAQKDMYFPNLTVTEQLKFFAMIKRKNESRSEIADNVMCLIKKLKLFNVKDSLPKKLCGDQKRKLCLGMAFVGDPSTLILDEPTSRMDNENKRLIWDILLEMRGKKTILISTHDMEEADILGDRIAIMHEGQLKSYGTSLFLKKMIGGQSNIDVTLSVERWSDPENIRTELHSEAMIVEKQDKKIIVSVPISSILPNSLNNLEKMKRELGISAYNLSRVGLEQVFLKVSEGCGASQSRSTSHEVCTVGTQEKLTGYALYGQSIRALIVKKLDCTSKELSLVVIQIFMVFVALLFVSIAFTMSDVLFHTTPETLRIQLDAYDNPYALYASSDETSGNLYKSIVEAFGARSLKITNTDLDDGLLRRAKNDLLDYNNRLIAAAEFNESTAITAFYSETIAHSLPLSVNLVWNTIVKNLLGLDYSISVSSQPLPHLARPTTLRESATIQGCVTAVVFVLPFYFAIAMFVVHPARESSRGIKRLQMMTGVSGFTYWTTTFVIDLMHYASLTLALVVGLICMDLSLGLRLYGIEEILIMILLLMLFAVNVLPLVYAFSFVRAKTCSVLKLLNRIPSGIEIVILIWKLAYDADERLYKISRIIYLVLPYASFLHGQEIFQETLTLNAFCRRLPDEFYEFQCKHFEGLCCEEHCHDRRCQKLIAYFRKAEAMDSLTLSVTYLCATPLLYFGILAVLEAEIIEKLLNACKCARNDVLERIVDDEVQREKSMVLKRIRELEQSEFSNILRLPSPKIARQVDDKQFFLTYELRKYLGKVRVVEDVSLSIDRGECFGIFGVNRSGKSMTFKMITSEEILDHGVMYIADKDYKSHKKHFLSQIGYCPQHDVNFKCLNSYEHLRLFARLRGIPEDQVDNVVEAWIERLNLRCFASQPSGTYSSGNKQRLNIAIALIGNPDLILMDEPTTGVDPAARRSLSNVIKSCQTAGQTFMLASHNMELCETLCKRIAIMLDGKLICIGTPEVLKRRFGAGYDVQIRLSRGKAKSQLDKIKKDMRYSLHCMLTNENSGFLMYHVVGTGTTWRKIYEAMNRIKSKYDCIDDFVIVVRLST